MADNNLKTKFPVDFTEGGDTTSQAIWKHIQEFVNVYEKMSEQEKVILERTLASLGSASKKNVGKSAGDVPIYDSNKVIDANISGNAAGTAKTITDVLPLTLGGTGAPNAIAACYSLGIIAAQNTSPIIYSDYNNSVATGGSYIKLFNGLKIQWGEFKGGDAGLTTTYSPLINMPIAFNDMNYQLSCTPIIDKNNFRSVYSSASRETAQSFRFIFNSTSGYVGNVGGSWIALGY